MVWMFSIVQQSSSRSMWPSRDLVLSQFNAVTPPAAIAKFPPLQDLPLWCSLQKNIFKSFWFQQTAPKRGEINCSQQSEPRLLLEKLREKQHQMLLCKPQMRGKDVQEEEGEFLRPSWDGLFFDLFSLPAGSLEFCGQHLVAKQRSMRIQKSQREFSLLGSTWDQFFLPFHPLKLPAYCWGTFWWSLPHPWHLLVLSATPQCFS